MECQSGARLGAAPAGISAADISACLPESVGQGSLVTEDQREVCPFSGRVMSPGGSTLIRSIPDRHSLSPSSFTRRPLGFSYESLSLVGRRRAYHVPPMCPSGKVAALRRWCVICVGGFASPKPDHVPFGPSVIASSACSDLRRLSLLYLG